MWKKCAIGLASLCLMTLFGCASEARLPARPVTVQTCAPVTPCVLMGVQPRTNGDLNLALEQAYADWAACAAQVDMILECQSAKAGSNSKSNH